MGTVKYFSGIKEVQPFATGRLIRPLLSFSKEDLYTYAAESQLVYFEDQTNQLLDIQRNRLRHLVVPQLKQENTQALRHFQQFSQQIQWADQVIQKYMGQLIEKEVEQWEEQFRFSAEMIEEMTDAERYYFLLLFRQSILKNRNYFERTTNGVDFRPVATEKANGNSVLAIIGY